MTKRHRQGRQGSQRSLTPIPTSGPPGDPQIISNRYTEEVRWEILLLEPVNDWFLGLCKNAPAVADKVEQAIDELAIWGPQLGRPLVDRIHGSKVRNLKELRPRVGGASEVRLLFVFDATREAIILVAEDKAGRWSGWYAEAIPLAEERYAVYQRENREKEQR